MVNTCRKNLIHSIFTICFNTIQVDERKVTSGEAAWLLSAIGITNVLGRIIFGIVADVCAGKRILGSSVKITALLINNCCLLCTALTAAAIPFCPSYWWLMVDCILFGFFICKSLSLYYIIIVYIRQNNY